MSETLIDFPSMPHEVEITSYVPHSGVHKTSKKSFPNEKAALDFACWFVPEELLEEAEACRYDEVIWTNGCIQWSVSVSLDLNNLVDVPKVRVPFTERIVGWWKGKRKPNDHTDWEQLNHLMTGN